MTGHDQSHRWLLLQVSSCLLTGHDQSHTTGCPKKMGLLSRFEFLDLGGVFLGVKNYSKNFGNKKNIGLYGKILSK